MVRRRLTRKEIVKEDPIRKALENTSAWLFEHRSLLVGVLGVVVVAVAASYLWDTYSVSRSEEVQSVFADALDIYHAPVGEKPAPEEPTDQQSPEPPEKYRFATSKAKHEKALEAFQNISKTYSGQKLGALARYYTGLSLMELDRTGEAQTELAAVVSESGYPEIKNLARNSLSRLEASKGNHNEAARLLEEILNEPSPNFPEQVVLLRLARTYELTGQNEQALERYRQVTSQYDGTQYATEAETRIRQLEPDSEQDTVPGETDPEGQS